MHVKVTNGVPTSYTIGQLRRDNPNTSFPKQISDSILADHDVYKVVMESVSEFDGNHYEVQNGSIELVNGDWVQRRTVVKRNADDVANNVRDKRNRLLESTDFYALSDVTMSSEMTAYRQALRDITDHADFPYLEDADWPVKP